MKSNKQILTELCMCFLGIHNMVCQPSKNKKKALGRGILGLLHKN